MMIDDYVGKEQTQPRVFDALADPYRRAALSVLVDTNREITLGELADEIGTWADDCPKTAEELHLTLRHIHAPKLAEAGLIDFDPRQGMARFQGDSEHVDRLLG